MHLIVGLGNPTDKHKNNRHNVGFMVIDHIVDLLKPSPVKKSSFKGELYKKEKLLLLKPQTFMNLSGESVREVASFYKIPAENIIVIHDDLDLPLGVIRFKIGGSSGGHNGLKSIDKHLSNAYKRVRIGIGRPKTKEEVVKYVLSDFTKEEEECLKNIVERAAKASLLLTRESIEKVANRYSSKKSTCR